MKKEEIYAMLPKAKHDLFLVDCLKSLKEEEIKQIIPELISWIADANWPVANPIADILLKYPLLIEPYIEKHLSACEEDDELKYNIISLILPRLPIKVQKRLIILIERICTNPTKAESYGSFEMAQHYFEEYKLML